MDNLTDPFTSPPDEQQVLVSAVLAHPRHGRLVEKLIFFVRPDLEFEGQRYQLTWWGGGVAYYKAVADKPKPAAGRPRQAEESYSKK